MLDGMAFGDQAQYPQLSNPFNLRAHCFGQPARAYLQASQVLPADASFHIVGLDTLSFDPYASSFNLSTNRFIPPATGYYRIEANVGVVGSMTSMSGAVFKNGVAGTELFELGHIPGLPGNSSTNFVSVTGSDVQFLIPTDFIQIACSANGATLSTRGGAGGITNFLTAQQVQ